MGPARSKPSGVPRSCNLLPLWGLAEVSSSLGEGNLGFLPLPGLRSSVPHDRVLAGKSPSSHRAAFLIHPGVSPVPAVPKSRIPSLSRIHNDLFYYPSLLPNPLPLFAVDRINSPCKASTGHHWNSPLPKPPSPPGSTKSLENKKRKKNSGEGGRRAQESLGLFSPGAIIREPIAQLAPGEAVP